MQGQTATWAGSASAKDQPYRGQAAKATAEQLSQIKDVAARARLRRQLEESLPSAVPDWPGAGGADSDDGGDSQARRLLFVWMG